MDLDRNRCILKLLPANGTGDKIFCDSGRVLDILSISFLSVAICRQDVCKRLNGAMDGDFEPFAETFIIFHRNT